MSRRFEVAPWPALLWGVSVFATVITFGALALVWAVVPPEEAGWVRYLAVGVILPLPVGSWLVRVLGYELAGTDLLVHRPIGAYRVPLAGLATVEVGASVMEGAIRLFGNGGFFGFSGWFWSRARGWMRLWVTDPARCVLLRVGGKTYVISPEDPEGFAMAVREAVPGAR